MPIDPSNIAITPRELVGLLADSDRLQVIAALVLAHTDHTAIRAATGLDARAVARALTRLVDAGLVIAGDDDQYFVLEGAFQLAARAAAAADATSDEHDDRPAEHARVFRAFVRNNRITGIPTAHSKRLVLLDWLAQNFEPGRRYSEAMVNLILGQFHADTAAWRRYLVDDGFLAREAGEYWRSGGTTDE